MRGSAIILLMSMALVPLRGVEVEIDVVDPWLDLEPVPVLAVGASPPGRATPAAAPPAAAWRFSWDDYVTLVVVAEARGKALRSPAWVVTYDAADKVAVAYRATAFRDQRGTVHIDARKALVTGPMRGDPAGDESWSPDSFTFSPDGSVGTIDDRNSAHSGSVIEHVEAVAGAAYRTLLAIAMACVRETS